MFTFHKSDAQSSSRQSSVDSPINGSSSSMSTSDVWTDDHSYGPMRHIEERQRAQSGKRNSVFNLRSRSNTSSSTASSIGSLGSPDKSPRPESPHTFGLLSRSIQGDSSAARKSIFRGRKGGRLSQGPVNSQEVEVTSKRSFVLRKITRRDNHSESTSYYGIKGSISSPFDFQHVTHTDRNQFATLSNASQGDLAAGYKAAHTSQQPSRNLTGIRADDLYSNNSSYDDLSFSGQRSHSAADILSPPLSPRRSGERSRGPPPQVMSSRPPLRLTRSVESFSQPVLTARTHHHSLSITGPSRISSLPTEFTDETIVISADNTHVVASRSPGSKRESGIWDTFSLAATAAEPRPSIASSIASYVSHALTTPDDIAIQAATPPFSPPLEDVAEEPELFSHPRAAPQPPIKAPSSPRSPKFESCFTSQRSPISKGRPRGSSNSSSVSPKHISHTRSSSQMSDTLGSSGLVRRISVRMPSVSHRQSNTWRAPEESWEDEIDFIYDNALEADCNLEWGRPSLDGAYDLPMRASATVRLNTRNDHSQSPRIIHPEFDDESGSPSQEFSHDFRASLLVPTSVPDLEPTSATSASTHYTGLRTSSECYGAAAMSPSLLVPHHFQNEKEHSYEDLLSQYEDHADSPYTFAEPDQSTASSAHNSARFSRRSSYDSSLVSSAQSSGLCNSPVRRSASSAGSVPDLVPSRRQKRNSSFSVMIDQLSVSVVSLKNLDEERESEEDVTPSGHLSEQRTFFPSETDEDSKSDADPAPTVNNMKSPLERVLQGAKSIENSPVHASVQPAKPNRSARHKQASSDGAAKLLASGSSASGTESRTRATSTQARRSPMLSMFPTPPRNSPTLAQL